jgi:hypothetical protein
MPMTEIERDALVNVVGNWVIKKISLEVAPLVERLATAELRVKQLQTANDKLQQQLSAHSKHMVALEKKIGNLSHS